MQLTDMPTDDLRRVLADTERTAGPDSASACVLRRELARRIALGLAPASALRRPASGAGEVQR